jgi:hypothetical protein
MIFQALINYPAASSGVFRAKPNYFLRGTPRGIYPERIKKNMVFEFLGTKRASQAYLSLEALL